MPQVSVIISTYNRSRVLRSALASVLAQTFQDFDVWVIGDACTDDSASLVTERGDPRVHWSNLPTRTGVQSGSNNEGLRQARGEFIAYGHDDLWFPWHLETLVRTAASASADFVQSGVIVIGPDGPREAYGDVRDRDEASGVPPSGWLHRRAIVDTCGPWRPVADEPVGVDVGFQSRAFHAGFRFAPTRVVSALKFPSAWWSLYNLEREFPQDAYLARMRADADRLLRDLLTDLVLSYGHRMHRMRAGEGLRAAMRSIQRTYGAWYGIHRWPLAQYLRWRVVRRRRRALARRGLGDFDPDKK